MFEQVLLDLIFQLATQKRKRVTNKGGQCLTNEAAMNILEAEAAAKKQKLIDSEIKKGTESQPQNKKNFNSEKIFFIVKTF